MPAGGRRINAAAFSYPTGVEGNAGRNIARGFNVAQMDLSVRREFPIHDQFGVQSVSKRSTCSITRSSAVSTTR